MMDMEGQNGVGINANMEAVLQKIEAEGDWPLDCEQIIYDAIQVASRTQFLGDGCSKTSKIYGDIVNGGDIGGEVTPDTETSEGCMETTMEDGQVLPNDVQDYLDTEETETSEMDTSKSEHIQTNGNVEDSTECDLPSEDSDSPQEEYIVLPATTVNISEVIQNGITPDLQETSKDTTDEMEEVQNGIEPTTAFGQEAVVQKIETEPGWPVDVQEILQDAMLVAMCTNVVSNDPCLSPVDTYSDGDSEADSSSQEYTSACSTAVLGADLPGTNTDSVASATDVGLPASDADGPASNADAGPSASEDAEVTSAENDQENPQRSPSGNEVSVTTNDGSASISEVSSTENEISRNSEYVANDGTETPMGDSQESNKSQREEYLKDSSKIVLSKIKSLKWPLDSEAIIREAIQIAINGQICDPDDLEREYLLSRERKGSGDSYNTMSPDSEASEEADHNRLGVPADKLQRSLTSLADSRTARPVSPLGRDILRLPVSPRLLRRAKERAQAEKQSNSNGAPEHHTRVDSLPELPKIPSSAGLRKPQLAGLGGCSALFSPVLSSIGRRRHSEPVVLDSTPRRSLDKDLLQQSGPVSEVRRLSLKRPSLRRLSLLPFTPEDVERELKLKLPEKLEKWCKPMLNSATDVYIPSSCTLREAGPSARNKEMAYSDVLSMLSAADPGARIVIPAESGMGKTRLLKYICDAWLGSDKNVMKFKYVFPMVLRYITNPTFVDALCSEESLGLLSQNMAFSLGEIMNSTSKQKESLIVVDSYEERQDTEQSDIDKIITGDLYENATVLILSRPHVFVSRLSNLLPDNHSVLKLDYLTAEQSKEFLVSAGLQSKQYKLDVIPTEILQSPLLLSVLCNMSFYKCTEENHIDRTTILKSYLCHCISILYKTSWSDNLDRKPWDLLGMEVDVRTHDMIIALGKACYIARKRNLFSLSEEILTGADVDLDAASQLDFIHSNGHPAGLLRFRHSMLQELLCAFYLVTYQAEFKKVLRQVRLRMEENSRSLMCAFQPFDQVLVLMVGLQNDILTEIQKASLLQLQRSQVRPSLTKCDGCYNVVLGYEIQLLEECQDIEIYKEVAKSLMTSPVRELEQGITERVTCPSVKRFLFQSDRNFYVKALNSLVEYYDIRESEGSIYLHSRNKICLDHFTLALSDSVDCEYMHVCGLKRIYDLLKVTTRCQSITVVDAVLQTPETHSEAHPQLASTVTQMTLKYVKGLLDKHLITMPGVQDVTMWRCNDVRIDVMQAMFPAVNGLNMDQCTLVDLTPAFNRDGFPEIGSVQEVKLRKMDGLCTEHRVTMPGVHTAKIKFCNRIRVEILNQTFPNLETLDISYCSMADDHSPDSPIPQWEHLKHIKMTKIEGLLDHHQTTMPQVEDIIIDHCKGVDMDVLKDMLTGLKTLHMGQCSVSGPVERAISEWQSVKNVKIWNVEGLFEILKIILPHTEQIEIENCSDVHLDVLEKMFPSLKHLEMNDCTTSTQDNDVDAVDGIHWHSVQNIKLCKVEGFVTSSNIFFPNVTQLTLDNIRHLSIDALTGTFSGLKSLVIESSTVMETDCETSPSGTRKLQFLEKLELRRVDGLLSHLRVVLPQVYEIKINSCHDIRMDVLQQMLPGLKSLDFGQCMMTDVDSSLHPPSFYDNVSTTPPGNRSTSHANKHCIWNSVERVKMWKTEGLLCRVTTVMPGVKSLVAHSCDDIKMEAVRESFPNLKSLELGDCGSIDNTQGGSTSLSAWNTVNTVKLRQVRGILNDLSLTLPEVKDLVIEHCEDVNLNVIKDMFPGIDNPKLCDCTISDVESVKSLSRPVVGYVKQAQKSATKPSATAFMFQVIDIMTSNIWH